MSVLRSLESKIESLFEGVFGRAFRGSVQPVELARKLVKEMDDHKTVSVSRVYVPNEYTVYLSKADREQFSGYENSLRGELTDYLSEHARRERYVLPGPPEVKLETDDELELGVFGIATRLVQPPKDDQPASTAPPVSAAISETMIYKPPPLPEPVVEAPALAVVETPMVERLVLAFAGTKRPVSGSRVVLGRSSDCDIQIPDANISRRHAELVKEGDEHWLVDLGSTNGIETSDGKVQRLKLDDGTRFVLGSTEIVVSRERTAT